MSGVVQAGPIITFYAPGGRIFQRFFRDASLAETKDAVRQKLDLPAGEDIKLSRIESGVHIDLDDDDDFDVFRIATCSRSSVDIAVTVGHLSPATGPASVIPPVAGLSAAQSASHSALNVARKRKREQISVVPQNESAFTAPATPSAKPVPTSSFTNRAAIDHTPSALSALRTGSDTVPPRKRRKKLRFRDAPTSDVVGRSASNPPVNYAPPTPDSLASGPSLPTAHEGELSTDVNAPQSAVSVHPVNSEKYKTTPRRQIPSSPAPRLTTQEDVPAKHLSAVRSSGGSSPSKTSVDVPDTGSEVKKSKSKKGKGVEREAVTAPEETPGHVETPRKSKKEKHAKTKDQATVVAAPESAAADDVRIKKKSKKQRKDTVGVEDATISTMLQSDLEVADVSVAVKSEKKSKKKRKNDVEQAGLDVQAVPKPVADASETSEKRKSKKKRKHEDDAAAPGIEATPKVAPEPTTVADAVAASSSGDKKGKKRKKEPGTESTRPAEPASTSQAPAAIDHQKAFADAMATIRARYSMSTQPTESNGNQGTSQSTRQEPTSAPVAGASTVAVAPPAKEKRKSKKPRTTEAATESAAHSTDPPTASKPEGKTHEGESSAAESSPVALLARSEEEILEMWNAVKAATLATLNRRHAALASPPAVAEHPASAPSLQPEVTPEVARDVSQKPKKRKKEKNAKSKSAAPEVTEAVDAEPVVDAPPGSPATTSDTAVETQQTKRKSKPRAKPGSKAAEREAGDDKDVDMDGQVAKPSEEISTVPQASPRPVTPPLPDVQMSSPARPPANSDVDEVIIEGHGEGSSDEGSSSDSDSESEDEDEKEGQDKGAVPDLSQVDMEALLRGPTPRKSILATLPSDSEGEDKESDDGEEPSEDEEEEEIRLDKKYRRLSQRFQRDGSSSAEELELEPEPEQKPDATQEEEEQEVVAATFMDVDPQETLEDEADSRAPPAVLPTNEVSVPNDDDVAMSAPGDEEHQGTTQPSPPPDGERSQGRPVSPTVSMMGVDHGGDDSQDVSSQSIAQIEEQLSQTSLKSVASDLDQAGTMNRGETKAATSQATSSEPSSTSPKTKRKASSQSQGKTSGGELEDDPIEPADDLIIPESPGIEVVDPIEPEPEPESAEPERGQSTPPPLPTSRPGTIQRMKNRDGKLGTPRPVKASELRPPSLSVPSFAALDYDSPPAPSAPQTQTRTEGSSAQQENTASSATPSQASNATPTPAPTPATTTVADPPAPKRRGRPPLPPEEKERRAAERKAKKDAEKAEKARLRQERAAAAASKRVGARGGRGAKAKPAPVVESEDEAEGEQAGKAEKAPLTATPRPGWTTLTQTQTPQTQDESMMVDELRSSSPAHSSPRAAEPAHTPRTPASAAMPPPSTQKRGKPRSKVGSQPEAQAQADAEPLFLPSSSQVPYTPYALARPQPQPGVGESSSESGDESGDEPIVQTQLQRARPWLRDAPFRRLSDIASQALFTPNSSFALTPVTGKDTPWGSEKKGADKDAESEDDDDDDDESDEDEDEGKKSHIPQERRAGAGVQKKRTSGLASFAK